VRVAAVRGQNFRCYERVSVSFPGRLVGVLGPNGAGKTSLVEMIHFGCLGFSPRTSNDAEVVRIGADFARVEDDVCVAGRRVGVALGYRPGEPKRVLVDGAPERSVERLVARFPVLVFTPDRLRLVKGAPALRRLYFDRVLRRVWPLRAAPAADYARALAQRNHLLRRIRAGASPAEALDPWDAALAREGALLGRARAELAERLAAPMAEAFERLGGDPGDAPLRYLPHTEPDSVTLAAALAARRPRDVERAATGAGPHLDDFALADGGRDLRRFGSQGEQRRALLALILAEADLLAADRGELPLLLLDDVTSEFDARRRGLLLDALDRFPQAILTTTDDAELEARADATVRVRAGRVEPA
jgi:DNA replication and repair protein RecF